MTLGNIIAQYRKKMNITQDALAQQLGVTNQAVSKWESDQCCPDVTLLPKLADIFDITLDELLGREIRMQNEEELAVAKRIINIHVDESGAINRSGPATAWPDDGKLRIVAFIGHKVVKSVEDLEKLTFQYEGPALNVDSRISVSCGDVEGDVNAGRDVKCGNVDGDVDAGSSVSCGNVGGDVDAGSHVGCGQVGGSVDAGTDVKCGDIFGNVEAGCNVECAKVEGDIDAGGSVTIGK